MLSAGANVVAPDLEGATPLHEARRAGAACVVHALLEAGAPPGAVDAQGRTPLHVVSCPGGTCSLGSATVMQSAGAGAAGGIANMVIKAGEGFSLDMM